ncbi:uncharacterized protein N7487_009305 [Penicillium crustosum]|uniref:uncharacterized protein n=1 Tax=Penicillium crustosum TaxID=36656 RepID=UPI0023A66582|nr:uncharacterized protein N7487_009305 [Penicillium crustosum]KAJ5395002.1 hypothetical protein N7487_009305 [Penicillium crustosum]
MAMKSIIRCDMRGFSAMWLARDKELVYQPGHFRPATDTSRSQWVSLKIITANWSQSRELQNPRLLERHSGCLTTLPTMALTESTNLVYPNYLDLQLIRSSLIILSKGELETEEML